jgi:glutaminyl-tRNA synthetase
VEEFEVGNNPEDPAAGTRKVAFSRVLYIEQDDFRDPPPPKYFRMSPGTEVRLRAAYIVKCTGVERDAAGNVVEVRCTYDPATRGGDAVGRKIKSTIHWVSAQHAIDAEVRLYDTLFTVPKPDDEDDPTTVLNPNSLEVLRDTKVERALGDVPPETRVQFERLGYFVADWRDSGAGTPVFNRTVGLRDTWGKIEKSGGG